MREYRKKAEMGGVGVPSRREKVSERSEFFSRREGTPTPPGHPGQSSETRAIMSA